MIGKQAKILKKKDMKRMLDYAGELTYPERNQVMILLSLKAGLRAKEIASLTWSMVTDASGELGDAIHLPYQASKGKSGRIIPLHPELREALEKLRGTYPRALTPQAYVIFSKHGPKLHPCRVVHWFGKVFKALGLEGCSSHSGRRTFITQAARKVSEVGGSLRDVQVLAGHSSLSITQRYIDTNTDAHRRLIALL